MSISVSRTAGSFPSTSTGLLRDALAGDQDAWRRFIKLYAGVVYRWIRLRGVPANDAPDAMQEVFWVVYRGLGSYDRAQGPFRNWLFIVARNAVVSFQRRGGDEPRADGGSAALARQLAIPAPEAASDTDTHDAYSQVSQDKDRREVLRAALELLQASFQPRTWEVACRLLVDGIDAVVVAQEFSITIGSVYTAKCRVLAKVRELLDGLEDQPF
jgi:RNA polymerase sigma-70 factor (ECF subfamily)